VKVKFNRRQEVVVGGFKLNPSSFESLLVGYYEGRKLMFASKVRAGLTPPRQGTVVSRTGGHRTSEVSVREPPERHDGALG
jgi:bifunctional non-homologous end joining protein LigD